LRRLLERGTSFEGLTWREFEELVGELLEADGYTVRVGPGRDDGGVDIVASKDLGAAGLFRAVWQAKKLRHGKKVGLSVIRELADTRVEQKASKGVIVTTTFLTRGALARVKRDEYLLGKVDGNDLNRWIERVVYGHSGTACA